MKQLLFLSALILICLITNAQNFFVKKVDLKIAGNQPGDTIHHKLNLVILNDLSLNHPEGKFLYKTEKGKVYALPPDNMLCLVPEYHSKMGIASSHGAFTEPMPNPLPKIELIPKD